MWSLTNSKGTNVVKIVSDEMQKGKQERQYKKSAWRRQLLVTDVASSQAMRALTSLYSGSS